MGVEYGMFIILPAGIVLEIMFVFSILMPPDFDKWEEYKLMLFSNNPIT